MVYGAYQVSMDGLAVERARIDASASNIANINSVAPRASDVYRFKSVVAIEEFSPSVYTESYQVLSEQKVRRVHNPDHPLADIDGMIYMPEIDIASEMLKLNMALRAYEANVRAFNSIKEINGKALEIGR